MTPGEPLDVSNLRRVELAYVIEDDFGVDERGARVGSRQGQGPQADPRSTDARAGRVQGKLMWDIAEVQVPSGGDVRYWIEAKDNDSIGGPNIGTLARVPPARRVSPRERHEETLERQQQVAEKLAARTSAARLVGLADDLTRARSCRTSCATRSLELASIGAAFDKDPHASAISCARRSRRCTTGSIGSRRPSRS